MKILAITSPRYSKLAKLFLSSISLDIGDKFIFENFDAKEDTDFGSKNYNLATKMMMRTISNNIETMKDGELFMYTDSDIVFNAPFSSFSCGDDDIRFQRDLGITCHCLGFIVAKVNSEIKRLFRDLTELTNETTNCQVVISRIIDNYKIKYSFFPKEEVCSYGLLTDGKIWNGEKFNIPECKAFHANYTIGTDNKLLLMQKALWKFQKK